MPSHCRWCLTYAELIKKIGTEELVKRLANQRKVKVIGGSVPSSRVALFRLAELAQNEPPHRNTLQHLPWNNNKRKTVIFTSVFALTAIANVDTQ